MSRSICFALEHYLLLLPLETDRVIITSAIAAFDHIDDTGLLNILLKTEIPRRSIRIPRLLDDF